MCSFKLADYSEFKRQLLIRATDFSNIDSELYYFSLVFIPSGVSAIFSKVTEDLYFLKLNTIHISVCIV